MARAIVFGDERLLVKLGRNTLPIEIESWRYQSMFTSLVIVSQRLIQRVLWCLIWRKALEWDWRCNDACWPSWEVSSQEKPGAQSSNLGKARIELPRKVAHNLRIPDGAKEIERDDWLLAYPGIQSNYRIFDESSMTSRLLDWLFGYAVYEEVDEISQNTN